jgi:hypothetical protein
MELSKLAARVTTRTDCLAGLYGDGVDRRVSVAPQLQQTGIFRRGEIQSTKGTLLDVK